MDDLQSPNYSGLTQDQARTLLKRDGYNELPSVNRSGFWTTIRSVLREPMFVLLIAVGIVYLVLGETKDALMLSSLIVFVVGITIYQERKTEKALEALKNLASPRALVVRDGREMRIPGREVVVGDVMIIKTGDRMSADAYVLETENLLVDESLLTGESLPVKKRVWVEGDTHPVPGGDNQPIVYCGTVVIQGRAQVKVFAAGLSTQMGKIGVSLETIADEKTLLSKETGRVVKTFTLVGGILCMITVIGWGLTRGSWMNGILAGLTLSMSMLPEEFPVVLTIFFTLGAWRLSKRQVLARHTAVIETLGAATVLCVDKTGTLTENQLHLETLMYGDRKWHVSDQIHPPSDTLVKILEYAKLASDKHPIGSLEKTISKTVMSVLPNFDKDHSLWEKVKEYPLSKGLFATLHIWRTNELSHYLVAAKGAPEVILDLCRISGSEKEKLVQQVAQMAQQGLRVLGVARADTTQQELAQDPKLSAFEFIGFLGFADPIRDGVKGAIQEAYRAGMRVIMITGDYPGTARSIACSIGLANANISISGEELHAMDHNELREKIKSVNIFARVLPEQKLSIVNALKANGEIVAMTGDGVNDAPALKAAHIGIAMGTRGTDVAREASDLVLVNDDFSSIVRAVRTGRKIYENIKKAIAYIFAVHVPIAGISIFPILFGMPIVLMPAHVAFLELIIDPACSTVFEAEHAESDIMQRPPRNLRQPMFSPTMILLGFMQGASILGIVLLIYIGSLYFGKTDAEARTLTFVAMVTANLALIVTNLSWSKPSLTVLFHATSALRVILIGVIVALGVILYVPVMQNLFHFSSLLLSDLLIALIAGIASLLWFEMLKAVNGKVNIVKILK